jgi:hypothetical protein
MGKKKRKKERVFGSGGSRGNSGPAGCGRAHERAGLARPKGERRHGRARRRRRLRAHAPGRVGGETVSTQTGKGGEPAVPWGEPGRRWVQRRFSAGDPVPGEWAGAIA